MDLEFHQLDLRYEALRKRSPRRERQLMASLAEVGQLLPIVVVRAETADRYVVVDGYKRVRAARRLRWDTVAATIWEIAEADALLLERMMRTGDPEGPLEQGWLLRELRDRFGLSQPELARRFDRTVSWVSRRLALVAELPATIQEHVRSGVIPAYAAMKYLVPLARANEAACARLVAAIAPARPTTRQVAELYAGWMAGSDSTRERLVADPVLYLRAQEEARRPEPAEKSPSQVLLDDFGALGGVARRAHRRVQGGVLRRLVPAEREEVDRCFAQARSDAETLFRRWEKESSHAGPVAPGSDSRAA